MAKDLLLQERMNDVILKIRHDGFPCRIPAHSLLLINKSSVFEEMLDERVGDEKPTILTVTGMKPATAVSVLKYIYENEYPSEVTADLILASQKFKLKSLEDHLLDLLGEDLTLLQACQIFEELQMRQPGRSNCPIKKICFKMMEQHAFTLFGSDIVLCLTRQTLTSLLGSDLLNVPDEAYLFWGVWRWARKECSMNDRPLKDEDVASYIGDLISLIRRPSVRNTEGIPKIALGCFNKCNKCRCRYKCPDDILEHASTFRPCPAWEDFVPVKVSQDDRLTCIQLSVEKDLMLVGLYLEIGVVDKEKLDCFIRVLREPENRELRRQRVCCIQASPRKLSLNEAPEIRMESQVTLHEPLFLSSGYIYSLQLKGNFEDCRFVWGSFGKRRLKVGSTFVRLHGEGVISVRELYVIPDVSVTWGPRGPEA